MSQNLDDNRRPGAIAPASDVRYKMAVCGLKTASYFGKKYKCVVCNEFFYEPPKFSDRPMELSCPYCYESHFESVETQGKTPEFTLLFRLGEAQEYLVCGLGSKEFCKSKAKGLRTTFKNMFVEIIVAKGKHTMLPADYVDEVYKYQFGS